MIYLSICVTFRIAEKQVSRILFAKILRGIGKTGTIKTGMYFLECLTGIWVDYLAANWLSRLI